MKKHLLFLIGIFFIAQFSIKAQITLTESDMPIVGDLYLMYDDTSKYTNLSLLGNNGANQIWDLSWILNHAIDTTYYIEPSTTPYFSTFPNANLSIGNNSDGYVYFRKTSSYLNVVGVVIPQDTSNLIFSVDQTVLSLPNTYLTNHKDTSIIIQTIYYGQNVQGVQIDSIKYKMTMFIDCVTDAWGDVTTPHYNLNTLRVKTITTQIDSSWGYAVIPYIGGSWIPYGSNVDVSTSYSWYANGHRNSIAEIEVKYDTITSSSYLINPILLEKSNVLETREIKLYPNPAKDKLYFTNLENKVENVELYNVYGSLSFSSYINSDSSVDIHNLLPGVYFYKLIDKNSNCIKKGKIIITK